jgi:hypothetical protein
MDDEPPILDDGQTEQEFPLDWRKKWIAGAAIPALLLLYGTWVILPPHFTSRHSHVDGIFVWDLIVLTWGVMAISGGVMCFCYYFFGGMTDWAWVEVLFVTFSLILFASVFALLFLLCAAEVFGEIRFYRT